MAVLSVYLRAKNRTSLLWQWAENAGDVWNGAQVTVPVVDAKFELVFEDKTTPRRALVPSLIAIDDLRLQDGQCAAFGSCSFDGYDFCTWRNVEDGRDRFDWQFGSSRSSPLETGPAYDLSIYLFLFCSCK